MPDAPKTEKKPRMSKAWGSLVVRGILAILFGVLTLAIPGISLMVLVALFGAYAFVDGIFSLVAAYRATPEERWGVWVLEGLAGIAAGVVTFFWPSITALALLFIIAAWALVTGVLELAAAVKLRRQIHGEWLLGLSGVLSVLFGLLLLSNPGAGILALVWLVGVYAIAFGVVMLVLARRLRKEHGEAPTGTIPTWRPTAPGPTAT